MDLWGQNQAAEPPTEANKGGTSKGWAPPYCLLPQLGWLCGDNFSVPSQKVWAKTLYIVMLVCVPCCVRNHSEI
jgi:hypothetical protein